MKKQDKGLFMSRFLNRRQRRFLVKHPILNYYINDEIDKTGLEGCLWYILKIWMILQSHRETLLIKGNLN